MKSYLYIIFAFAIWSTWGLAVRALGLPVPVIVFYNALFSLAFQGAGLLWVSRRQRLRMGRGIGPIFALGLFSLINVFTYFYALETTTVANSLLTHYTAPVFVAVLAPFLLKDRMDGATLAALALSAAGLLVIFSRGLGLGGGGGLIGAAAGTASGVAYAFIIILSRILSPGHHPLKIIFYQGLVSVAIMGAYVLPAGMAAITLQQGMLLAAVGLFHSTIALGLYLEGIRGATAQEAGVLGYFEPFFGITLAYLFLGETPNTLALAGGAMIILSGAAIVLRAGRAEPVVNPDCHSRRGTHAKHGSDGNPATLLRGVDDSRG